MRLVPDRDREGVPLEGGFQADVRRVGDRVVRPGHATSRFLDLFLRHFNAVGFDGSPRSLGFDSERRHVVEYLEGQVATGRPPSWVWTDDVLVAVARLIRRFHDAAVAFMPPAEWRTTPSIERLPPIRGDAKVVCHNDLAPWNTVFSGRQPRGFIDWDSAAPGTRSWDLAFALWHWVPLYPVERRQEVGADHVTDLPARARRFLRAYGLPRQEGWIDAVLLRQEATCKELSERAHAGAKARYLWDRARLVLEARWRS